MSLRHHRSPFGSNPARRLEGPARLAGGTQPPGRLPRWRPLHFNRALSLRHRPGVLDHRLRT